jgi:IS605 OrfB family transposase
LEYLKTNQAKVSEYKLRDMFVTTKDNQFIQENRWLVCAPKAVRQQASFEAHKNFKQHGKKCENKVYNKDSWCIGLENIITILPNKKVRIARSKQEEQKELDGKPKKKKTIIRYQGRLPNFLNPNKTGEDKIVPGCQVQLQKINNNYYIIIPIEKPKHVPESMDNCKMIGLDPGIRKFLTGYGSDGKIVFFGTKYPGKKFVRTMWYKDRLDSMLRATKNVENTNRVTGKKRKYIKKTRKKVQERMNNIRKDFHHKVADWITKNYEVISIGKLPKNIISRDKHLPKVVKRAYNALSHFKFRCCLEEKAIERGRVYSAINESYTSKTCTVCGCLREIGSSEVFSCTCCNKSWDRDLNGARNILIKSISESYLRIIRKNDTLSLGATTWTKNPRNYSLAIEILNAK